MLDERKKIILYTIIKEHVRTAEPVGSEVLVDKYNLDISAATVRNEMAELENEGFIVQPYTSAGRIPTEKAYDLYLENLVPKKLNDSEAGVFDKLLKNKTEENFKQTAKAISKISKAAVFWAFHRHNLFYTGISNLFHQPEFSQSNLIYDISEVIDKVDEIIDDIFDEVKFGTQILIGSKNPFSNFCSTILAKYKLKDHTGMYGILGPMRMDYEKNLAIISYLNTKISR